MTMRCTIAIDDQSVLLRTTHECLDLRPGEAVIAVGDDARGLRWLLQMIPVMRAAGASLEYVSDGLVTFLRQELPTKEAHDAQQ